jgi:hypothetical protein
MLSEENVDLNEFMSGFTGTEAYHRITVVPINVTDGIKAVADKAKAYWLFDAIASYQIQKKVKNTHFQVWMLKVAGDKRAILTMQGDSNTKNIVEQKIEYTDFPYGDWKFYLIDGVLLLPSEY